MFEGRITLRSFFHIIAQILILGSSEEPLSQGSRSLPRAERKTTPTPDPELDIGSMVEVMSTTKPMYGLIKWIGHLPDQKDPSKLIAGLEMVGIGRIKK